MRKKYTLIIFLTFLIGCKTEKKEIKIGGIFSTTGVAGDYGKKSLEGYTMAIELINSNGGINGKILVPVYEDAKSSPKDAISAYNKLVNLDNVKFIIGDVYSSTTKSILEQIDDNVLLFAPGASKPDLVDVSKNFIRNWVSDDFDGVAMANVMYERKVDSIGIINQLSDYSISLKQAFKKEFEAKGGFLVKVNEFSDDITSYDQILLQYKELDIKNVYLVGLSKQVGQILKRAKEIGYQPNWFTNLTVNTEDCRLIAGNARNGVIFTEPFINMDKIKRSNESFYKNYMSKYNVEPDATVAHAYDAVNILAKALEESENVENVVDIINSVRSYNGVSGETTFDGNGGVLKSIQVMQIIEGRPTFLKVYKF